MAVLPKAKNLTDMNINYEDLILKSKIKNALGLFTSILYSAEERISEPEENWGETIQNKSESKGKEMELGR